MSFFLTTAAASFRRGGTSIEEPPAGQPPTPITNIEILSLTRNQVTGTWQGGEGADYFEFTRVEQRGTSEEYLAIMKSNIPGPPYSYNLSVAPVGYSFYAVIRAVNDYGASHSEEIYIQVPAA